MSVLYLPALLSLLLSVSGTPLPGSPAGRTTTSTMGESSESRLHGSSKSRAIGPLEVFDFNITDTKRRAVLAKYSQASSFLHGLNIIRENDITGFVANEYSKSTVASAFIGLEGENNMTSQDVVPSVPIHSVLPLQDYVQSGQDILYYGEGSFGTSKTADPVSQTLSFDVDTGSADLWLPSRCPDCVSRQFEPSDSATYKSMGRKFFIDYAAGSASGTLGRDTVTMAGLTYDEQIFGLVNEPSEEFAEFPSDGLLGLSFGTIARSRSPTFVENLIKAKKIRPMFSLHLTRNEEVGSQLCLGCIDITKMLGEIHWAPVLSKTYWTVGMDGLSVNGKTSDLAPNFLAAIDSGTTLVYFPMSAARTLYNMIPGARPWTYEGYWTFPCDSTLSVGISLHHRVFTIKPADFNLGRASEDSTYCVGGIIGLNEIPPNLAIIGDEFLKSWYTIYSYEQQGQVGFAHSINNK